MIHLEDLTIGYRSKGRDTVVARGLNADINAGELTCLLGTNGVGKSTLLRTLSAFQPPLGGTVSINGRPISEYTDKELARTVGVVLTDKPDVQNMTVSDMVALGRSPYTGFWGGLSREDLEVVDRSMAFTGIERLSHRMVHTLSDGERQKVMIAKALAQETPVILLDEPTAFLDFPSKVEMMQLLHDLSRKTQKTIFLSTHDLELALQAADRIWLLHPDKGLSTGSPEDLALDGTLGSFFVRKGIAFDNSTGLFRIEFPCLRALKLTGGGQRNAMLRKALARNGISTNSADGSTVSIECGDNGFTISKEGRTEAVTTGIAETVEAVERILTQTEN